MSLICWNYRGLGRPRAVQALRGLLTVAKPDLVFLSETKSTHRRMRRLQIKMGFDGCFTVDKRGKSGGLCLLWKDRVDVTIRSFSMGHIDADVVMEDGCSWRLTGFYGNPNEAQRDLGYNGYPFTWSNRREHGHVKERLDRAVATHSWRQLYPTWRIDHLGCSHSDHLPVHIQLAHDSSAKKKWRPIQRFDPFWLKDEESWDIFSTQWRTPSNMQDVMASIEGIRSVLYKWGREKYGTLRKEVVTARRDLQDTLNSGESTDQELEALQANLGLLEDMEEEYWHQRSREDWMTKGDRNTKFFHQRASTRKDTNLIGALESVDGVLVEDEARVQNIIQDYFQNIFKAQGDLLAFPTNLPFKTLSSDDQNFLCQPFTKDEMLVALKQLSPNKAPGPDGMQPLFLQKFWHVIGEDVIRIKKVIATVIDESQSAFISDRLITDNAIIAFEAFHSMQTGQGVAKQCMALKLDLSKAFDRVEWSYLKSVMESMCFPPRFVQLIMGCITTVSISILVNGQPTASFQPTRGIRQGDPLSPFLFLLCAEGLSTLIRDSVQQNLWRGIRFGRNGPVVNHLLFADDSLLFFECFGNMINEVRRVLHIYTAISGQLINLEKSEAFFPRHAPEDLIFITCNNMGVRRGDGKGKYLGLPFMTGRSKKDIFKYVEERVRRRVTGWQEKLLSQAGREILIKSIIQVLPSYIMQCFTLPVYICSTIESMTKYFWWSNSNKGKPIYWKSWADLCQRKQEGGMGFRDIRTFNLALLAKQGWRIMQRPDSLVAQVLKSKYFEKSSFMDAQLGGRPSYLWRSIVDGRKILEIGFRYRVDDGNDILIWNDKWLPKPPSFKAIPVNKEILPHGKVSDLIDEELRCWNGDMLQNLFLPHDITEILKISLSSHGGTDNLIWHYTKSGVYTVKSGHHAWQLAERMKCDRGVASSSRNHEAFWTWLWHLPLMPKVRMFAWKSAKGILATMVNLHRRKLSADTSCQLCWHDYEDEVHCLLGCRWLEDYWADFLLNANLDVDLTRSIWEVLDRLRATGDTHLVCEFLNGCWIVWRNRCWKIFENEAKTVHQLKTKWSAFNHECNMLSRGRNALVQQPSDLVSSWSPPGQGIIAINVDAAFGIDGNVACGILVRDSEGRIQSSASIKLPSFIDVFHGECLAIREGLRMAELRGDARVELWSDFLSSVQGLNGNIEEFHPLASIIQDCKILLSRLSSCKIGFVRRNGNQPAHLLAKLGLQVECSTSWGRNPPQDVCIATLNDLQ